MVLLVCIACCHWRCFIHHRPNKPIYVADPYPIVPGFQDWEFPHGRIPDFWPQTITGTPVTPPLCGVTNCSYAAEEAHLVPKTEVLWYQRNKMERYGQDLRDINDVANVTHMRSDLHKSFDDHQFVIVPKVDDAGPVSSPTGSQYATHIVWKKAAELWPTHHDILVQNLPQISCPYLFARFAWTVLFQARPFLIRGISRHVIRVSASEDDKLERNAEFLTGPQLMRFYGGGGSEAAAPMRKRVKGGWARR